VNATAPRIRFGTEIITFFNTAYWGLGEGLSYPEWIAAVQRDPRFYFDRILDAAQELGLDGIELAPDPGGWTTALAAYGDVDGVQKALRERDLALGSSYTPSSKWLVPALTDPSVEAAADEHLAAHARFLGEFGADTIVMGTAARELFAGGFDGDVPAEAFERVAAQLNRLGGVVGAYGVRLALHTDAYSICSRPADIDTLLSLTDPATVQLCPDAGHIALDGGDPVEVLRKHVGRVPVMHWKDCTGPLHPGTLSGPKMVQHETMLTYFRVLGAGSVRWHDWQRVLRDNDWSGWAQAEIDMSPDPVAEVRQAIDYFRAELAPIYR
jgi:inosose dehydratase